jgi:hypothetical protein
VKRTPLRRISLKRQRAAKSPEGRAGKAHMAKVAQLPCIICGARPVEVHHCIHGRYSTRRAPDMDTISLCIACHRELHAAKARWESEHGPDTSYLPAVRALCSSL